MSATIRRDKTRYLLYDRDGRVAELDRKLDLLDVEIHTLQTVRHEETRERLQRLGVDRRPSPNAGGEWIIARMRRFAGCLVVAAGVLLAAGWSSVPAPPKCSEAAINEERVITRNGYYQACGPAHAVVHQGKATYEIVGGFAESPLRAATRRSASTAGSRLAWSPIVPSQPMKASGSCSRQAIAPDKCRSKTGRSS